MKEFNPVGIWSCKDLRIGGDLILMVFEDLIPSDFGLALKTKKQAQKSKNLGLNLSNRRKCLV